MHNVFFFSFFFFLIFITTTTTNNYYLQTTTTISDHHHPTTKTSVPTTSSAHQNATTTATTTWDGEQRRGGGGFETPTRWVFFTSTITIFLLTNDLLDASPFTPCWWPLPQPHWPQLAPMSHNDSLVPFFASPSTTQATPSTNKSIWLIGCFSHLSLNHTSHNKHQQVVETCWWPLPLPCRLHQAPMSHYDSLVAFFTSPMTTLATTSTNESLWLVGFHLSFDHAGHNWHQRVIMTRWCLFSPLPWPRRLQPAPTSHYNLLVHFFSYPSTMPATTSTNEPLWLIGYFFCFSLDHAGHTRHQRVIMTRWLPFFTSTLTITTISLLVVFYIIVVIILLYIWNINLLSTRSTYLLQTLWDQDHGN